MSRYIVKIDAAECIGYGQCVNIAPELFELEAGVARVVVTETSDPAALDAAAACPMSAILVEEEAQRLDAHRRGGRGRPGRSRRCERAPARLRRDRHDPVGRLSPVANLPATVDDRPAGADHDRRRRQHADD